jgi:hypothetical protein
MTNELIEYLTSSSQADSLRDKMILKIDSVCLKAEPRRTELNL